jgi:endonuclease/exonuclease/phosphatase family metal-dependent hydrolase
MDNTIKIISWNIAGARTMKSDTQFDYEPENQEYFVEQIQKFDPDVVCLQENLVSSDRSVGKEIAEKLKMECVFDSSAGHIANHVDDQYERGMTIMSKSAFEIETVAFYPDPPFELRWKDGSLAAVHHKFLQVINFSGVRIANTQMLPIRLWGYEYGTGVGFEYTRDIEDVLMQLEKPVIFAGDFNFNEPEKIYPDLFRKLGLKDALPETLSRPSPSGEFKKPDHIFYSAEFSVVRSEIVTTLSDHYLCFAEFKR